jgi:DNA polymerase III beta subunit, central domain
MAIKINRKLFKAVSFFSADNDNRNYLNSIHVKVADKVVRVEASDGNALATANWTISDDEVNIDVIIPLPIVSLAIKSKADTFALQKLENGQFRIFDVWGLDCTFASVDGRYPETERVWPREKSELLSPIAPKILNKVDKACTAIGRDMLAVDLIPFERGHVYAAWPKGKGQDGKVQLKMLAMAYRVTATDLPKF